MSPVQGTKTASDLDTTAELETIRQLLRRLQLVVNRRLAGLVHGDYRGMFPGPGSEAGDGRPYVLGDDVRLIDWNLTARTGQTHVRDPISDHELDLWLVVDLSPSVRFGTVGAEKLDLVLLSAAAFGFPARRMANRIGAVLIEAGSVRTVRPGSSEAHLQSILRQMAMTARDDGGGQTDLSAALDRLGHVARRRGLVAIVSDFLVRPGWDRSLCRLAARHNVIAVQVLDPRELVLPAVGYLALQDPETGATRIVPTGNAAFRARYEAAAAAQQAAIAAAIRSAGSEHLVLRTDVDWLAQLVRFFDLRRRRLYQYRPPWAG